MDQERVGKFNLVSNSADSRCCDVCIDIYMILKSQRCMLMAIEHAYMVVSSIIPPWFKRYSHLRTRVECKQSRFYVEPVLNFDIVHCMATVSFRLNYLPDNRVRSRCNETCIGGLPTPFREDNRIVQNHLKERFVRDLWGQDSFLGLL